MPPFGGIRKFLRIVGGGGFSRPTVGLRRPLSGKNRDAKTDLKKQNTSVFSETSVFSPLASLQKQALALKRQPTNGTENSVFSPFNRLNQVPVERGVEPQSTALQWFLGCSTVQPRFTRQPQINKKSQFCFFSCKKTAHHFYSCGVIYLYILVEQVEQEEEPSHRQVFRFNRTFNHPFNRRTPVEPPWWAIRCTPSRSPG